MKYFIVFILLCLIGLTGFSQQPVVADSAKNHPKPDSVKQAAPVVKTAEAQRQQVKQPKKDMRPLKDRIDVNFSTSFWASSWQAYFNASILVTYRFPKILSLGAGPLYVFSHRKDVEVNLNGFGGQVIARAQLLKFFYLWTSYQGISNQYLTDVKTNPVSYTWNRNYVDSWYAGAGVNIHLGRRFGFNFSVLYDFLYDPVQSPFHSNVSYQVGFGF